MNREIAKLNPAGEIRSFLAEHSTELAAVCAAHLSPEKVVQLAVTCTFRNPELLKCDRMSFLAAVVQASSLGLDLAPSLGEAYLIPRWNGKTKSLECMFQPGYQGLAKLARESGEIRMISTDVVREGDHFSWQKIDGSLVMAHEPARGKPRGRVTDVYAVAKLATGELLGEIMDTEEVEYIRSKSQKPNDGPWADHWGEMARKTVLRRLCKHLPKTPRLAVALEAHDADFDLAGGTRGGARLPGANNNSGHATGQYASPDQTKVYLASLDSFLEKRNQQWLDRWQEPDGSILEGVKELCGRWQADGHIVKWCVATGRLDPASVDEHGQIKNRQIGRYSAIIYHRSQAERGALGRELREYLDKQERIQLERLMQLHPDRFKAEDSDDVGPDDDFPGDPEPVAAELVSQEPAWEEGRE